ncbi:MAG TPA: glycosyltransferase family 39 protein [Candidatus Krumholzibacteria bacterium]|nr:glycosyltransferase family 39 protein [Candidatus Krumholzibacteria bacterium]
MQRRTWALTLAALVVRLAIWALRPGLTYDGTYYLRQAERIFHLDFQVIGFPPGYPLAVAFVRLLCGDFELAGRLVSLVSGIATVSLFAIWARRHLSPRLAMAATLVLALHPEVARNSVEIMSEPLYILCVIAGVMALEKRRDLAAGALLGFAFLVRPEALVLLVGGAAWRLWEWRQSAAGTHRDMPSKSRALATGRELFPWRFLVIGFLPVVVYSAIASQAVSHWVLTPKQGQIDIDADVWRRLRLTLLSLHTIFPVVLLPGALWVGWHTHRLLLLGVVPILALPFFTIHIQPRLLLPLLPFLLVLGLAWVMRLRRATQRLVLAVAAVLLCWGASSVFVSLRYPGIVTPFDKALGAQLHSHLQFEDRVASRFPIVPYYAGSGFVRVPNASYLRTMDSLVTARATHLLLLEHEVIDMVPQLRPLFDDANFVTAESRLRFVTALSPPAGPRALLYQFRSPALASSQLVDSTATAAAWLGNDLVCAGRDGRVRRISASADHDSGLVHSGLGLVTNARALCASADGRRVAFVQQLESSTRLAEVDLTNAVLHVHDATAADMPHSPCYVGDALLYVRGAGSGGLRVLEPNGRVRAVYLAGLTSGQAQPLFVAARGRDIAITFIQPQREIDSHRIVVTAVWPAVAPADSAIVLPGRWATQLSLADEGVTWLLDADRLIGSLAVNEVDENGDVIGGFSTLAVFDSDGRLRTLGLGLDKPRRPVLGPGHIAFLTAGADLRTAALEAEDLRIPEARVFDAPRPGLVPHAR